MKTIKSLLLLLPLILLSCKSETTETSEVKENEISSIEYRINSDYKKNPYTGIDMYEYEIDGIEYHLYEEADGIFVVNHTKELLEVEKLKKELGK